MGRGWEDAAPAEYQVHRFPNGDPVYIHKRSSVSNLTIGRYSYISSGCVMGGLYPIVIGAFCSIANDVYCWSHEDHQTRFVSTFPLRTMLGVAIEYPEIIEKPQGIRIGNDVWVGHQARIAAGVTLGDGCIIGARAVVTRDCEPYGIYAGVPARLLRKRFKETVIAELLALRWWDWPIDFIRQNAAFFGTDLENATAPLASYVARAAG